MLKGSRNPIKAVKFLLLASILMSCEKNIVHEQLIKIDEATWNLEKEVQLNWIVDDTINSFDIYIVLQHNERYPYRNLFLFTQIINDYNFQTMDTLAVFLAKANGEWTGKGSGALINHRLPYLVDYRFERLGDYQLMLRHGMRDDDLVGIENIGILIKKHLVE